jgi:hypothetical protein
MENIYKCKTFSKYHAAYLTPCLFFKSFESAIIFYMYSIPPEINVKLFENANIQQICFAGNNIVISMEKVGFVQIENDFIYHNNNLEFPLNPYLSGKDLGMLLNLIEKKVLKVETDINRRKLIIYVEGSQCLEMLNNEHYESFILKVADRYVII